MKQFGTLSLAVILLVVIGGSVRDAGAQCIKAALKSGKVKLSVVAARANGSCPSGAVSTATGPAGARGASAFDPIPSGTTVRGIIGEVKDLTQNTNFVVFSSLLGIAPSPLADATVIVKANPVLLAVCPGQTCLSPNEQANQSLCTGTSTNPTAPAGAVCIYPVDVTNTIQPGSLEGLAIGTDDGSKSKSAFAVRFTTGIITNSFVGIWAYTAP
jgi:hypothetical protein